MDIETHVLDSPARSQPWYNFSEDTPVRPANRSKPIPGPSRLIAALDAADIIEISSSEEDENVIDLTGLDETPSKKRATTAKSKGKAVSSVSNDKPWVVLSRSKGFLCLTLIYIYIEYILFSTLLVKIRSLRRRIYLEPQQPRLPRNRRKQ